MEVYIETNKELLVKRNIKKKFFKLKNNVLGKDIKVKKPHKPHLTIYNNSSKKIFLKNKALLDYSIKKKKIKIY